MYKDWVSFGLVELASEVENQKRRIMLLKKVILFFFNRVCHFVFERVIVSSVEYLFCIYIKLFMRRFIDIAFVSSVEYPFFENEKWSF